MQLAVLAADRDVLARGKGVRAEPVSGFVVVGRGFVSAGEGALLGGGAP